MSKKKLILWSGTKEGRKEYIGPTKKSRHLDRFYLVNKFVVNLITAEETYLEKVGWKMISNHGLDSMWSHPRYVQNYSRNHAILIAKADDQNLGIL